MSQNFMTNTPPTKYLWRVLGTIRDGLPRSLRVELQYLVSTKAFASHWYFVFSPPCAAVNMIEPPVPLILQGKQKHKNTAEFY